MYFSSIGWNRLRVKPMSSFWRKDSRSYFQLMLQYGIFLYIFYIYTFPLLAYNLHCLYCTMTSLDNISSSLLTGGFLWVYFGVIFDRLPLFILRKLLLAAILILAMRKLNTRKREAFPCPSLFIPIAPPPSFSCPACARPKRRWPPIKACEI